MNNFLFCFDSNYNIPASCSMISLLDNVDEKINIYIMHQDESDFEFLIDKITKHKMLNDIKVYKVNLNNFTFPNVLGSHVSDATYYRLFIQDYIKDEIGFITYLDCDVFCISNPIYIIKKEISKLKKSNFSISSLPEPSLSHYGKKLNMKSSNYFNAGVMIINLETWKKNNLQKSFLKILNTYNTKLHFWDQDILNIYFDGNFQVMDENLNYKVDMEVDNSAELIDQKQKENIIFLHYSGKFKPWSVRGAVNDNSKYFQETYRNLFEKKYYISFNYKKNAINDFVESIRNKTIFDTEYPLQFIKHVMSSLIKK